MALGLVLTGHFSNLFVFTSLILIHEVGHFFMAVFLRYKVEKIIIYPYGGLTKIDSIVNSNINKDLLVAISGLVVQSIYFLIIYIMYSNGYIREYIYNLFLLYHKSMFIFNLLPIIPLDGFKILNLFLCKLFSFNLSNNISVFVSLCTIVLFFLSGMYEENYSILLTISILMKNIYKFYYDISYVYSRFLLERYLYDINYKDKKIINDEKKMYKNKSHFFVKNGRIVKEKLFLKSFFEK